MSKRLDVLLALKALVIAALPGVDVKGLDQSAALPANIPANGLVIVRSGDPGEPDIDLSPPAYNFSHRIPLEMAAYQSGAATSEQALDAMMAAIGAAIAADRTLGGRCHWLDAMAPGTDAIVATGARSPLGADLMLVADYTSDSPLL